MKITILTFGSRGDVQPFLPLSLGLMRRGHRVVLAAPSPFKNLVEEHGIPFYPLAGDPQELSRRLNDAGFNFLKLVKELMSHAMDIGAEMMRQVEDACDDADLIIHTFAHAVGAHTLAREKNIPDIHIQTFPMFTPTGDYPNVSMPDFGLRSLNYLSHLLSLQITMLTSKFGFEQVRRRAGLPKRNLFSPFTDIPPRLRTPILCAWSPSILPRSNDWDSHVYVTGYYFFAQDNSYQPSSVLNEFLKSGKAPVCISFGSMVNKNGERVDMIVREALLQTNHRGIVLSGWGGARRPATKDLLYVESVPHDWLLPRSKMIIHHGGAGTTSAALRAGTPQIIIPFMADQPFWGARIYANGLGPRPIRVNQLSVEKMVGAIVEAESGVILKQVNDIGQRIGSENGIECAIDIIEDHMMKFNKVDSVF